MIESSWLKQRFTAPVMPIHAGSPSRAWLIFPADGSPRWVHRICAYGSKRRVLLVSVRIVKERPVVLGDGVAVDGFI